MAEKVEGKETPPVEVETPKVETLTPEEQMEAYKTQLTEANEATKQAQALAEEKEKGFKRLQRQLSEKKKATPQASTSGTARALQEMIGAIEAQAGEVGELSPVTQSKLNAARQQLAGLEQQAVYERQEAVTNQYRDSFIAKIEATGLDPDDEKFDRVWNIFDRAEDRKGVPGFEQAEKRLDRILKSAEPKKEEPKKEPELAEDDERVQVAARKLLEKEGKLKTHEGTPSGASGSDADFKKGLGDGSIPLDKVNMERAKKLGLAK